MVGAVHYHHFLLPHPVVSKVISHTETKVKDDMPLYAKISRGSITFTVSLANGY